MTPKKGICVGGTNMGRAVEVKHGNTLVMPLKRQAPTSEELFDAGTDVSSAKTIASEHYHWEFIGVRDAHDVHPLPGFWRHESLTARQAMEQLLAVYQRVALAGGAMA